ncbi:hypothetical protein [Aquimarina brevivitae]|uniref:Uncharacterized protein n=1 Tax=Aquimarina brevivitae TaxID=323412 RepID=A0A4Q7P0T7_9FLAO|nr:hypothetical protein [Aquimarina brevivitae]RZS93416.1 hypothetical protein EV197_1994 [Aquimarina brevivitae]
MKNVYLSLLILLLSNSVVTAQVTPNSKRFEVKNYIAIDNNGQYYPYHSHGFVENVGSGSSPRIFIMPILEFDLDHIKYINQEGLETSSSTNNLRSISIPITAEHSLPNESQKAAIGATLSAGTTLNFYYGPIAKNNMGGPLIDPNAGMYTPQIMAQANKYEQNLKKQQEYIDAYKKYTPELISLLEYEVIMKVGNDVVYDQRFPGSYIAMGNSLDDISIDYPSNYVKNRIKQGNFNLLVKYKFKDSKNSYINASIDAKLIIDQFLSEAQQSTVSQKSSGWSFLGFGSRRKSIKSHFDQQVNQQYNAQRFTNTTIEMYDADDEMIAMFEELFFPKLAKQKVIDNHLAAAEKAKQSGNTELQKLHLDYVKSLQNNDPDLEVNVGEAAAALARKDYVGFIAHGVRWGDYQASGNSSFRRVLNSSEMSEEQSKWSQTKKITVQHAVTQKVGLTKKVKLRAFIGLIDGIPYQGRVVINNGFMNQWENIKGIITGPVVNGGSLHQNNIISGIMLLRVGNRSVNDAQSLTNALNGYDPGDNIPVEILERVGNNVYRKKDVYVTLGGYPMAN